MLSSKLGPYSRTEINRAGYLDILNIIPVPAEDNDILYEITSAYHRRPDLLAYDLYGKKELWWVFTQRNMDTIKDPIYDFAAGTKIYLPKLSNLTKIIGV